jgi:hypothetical protein
LKSLGLILARWKKKARGVGEVEKKLLGGSVRSKSGKDRQEDKQETEGGTRAGRY